MRALTQAGAGRTVNQSSKTVSCLVLPIPEAGSKAVRTLTFGYTWGLSCKLVRLWVSLGRLQLSSVTFFFNLKKCTHFT